MKKSTLLAAFAASALVATGIGASAAQAAPASANTNARARVLKQLTITQTSELNFGTIVAGASAGTVAIAVDGTATCGAGLTCTGATTAAGFDVTGSNGTLVTVTAPSSVTLQNLAGDTMTASLSAPATMTLNNSGNSPTPLVFGGTLNVGASQADGAYNVQFNVSVDYQ